MEYSNGLKYCLNIDQKSYKIIGVGICCDKDLVIPEFYQKLPITHIDNLAFENCEFLHSIIVSHNVIVIQNSAFKNCKNLKSVIIKNGLINIGYNAFYNCESLVEVFIPESVKIISECSFRGCKALENIIVDKKNKDFVSIYGDLYNKPKRTLLKYACGKKQEKCIIPDGVNRIGYIAFENAVNLREVYISETVKSIGYDAFNGCTKLVNFIVPNESEDYQSINGVIYTKDKKKLVKYPCGKVEKEYYVINDAVEIEGAFLTCNNLVKVILGSNVNVVGYSAFESCGNLKEVILNDNLEIIATNVFYNCKKLQKIIIPESVTDLGQNVFLGCDNLTIYCKVSTKLEDWSDDWNSGNNLVVWDYKE